MLKKLLVTRFQIPEGGDGLPIWRIAANILNKLLRRTDKRWSSNLGVGLELIIPDGSKRPACCEILYMKDVKNYGSRVVNWIHLDQIGISGELLMTR
jgi:hypothetical protein